MKAVERVLDAPHRRDPIADEREEVDLVDRFEAPARRGVAAPLAERGRRTLKAPDDRVALGDELHQLHMQIRKRAAEAAKPVAGKGGHLRREQLVDQFVTSAVDRFIYEAPHVCLLAMAAAK